MSACNYSPDAIEDDGSCAYEEDCFGECGGSAVIDECGECGGDGPVDFYDCNGNFIGTNVQVIHNSADPTVDIYVDNALAVESFEYRTATPVLTLPIEPAVVLIFVILV